MSNDYKDNRKKLGELLKTEQPIKTPIQEVRPVEPQPAPETMYKSRKNAHLNFWVPDELMKRLKIYSATSGKTIREVGMEALEEYLSKKG